MKRVKKQIGLNVAIEQVGIIDKSLPVSLLSPKDNHADQDESVGNRILDKMHPMDALTATKAVVFVIEIKLTLHLNITI